MPRTTILDLNYDILYLIIEHIWLTAETWPRPGKVPPNRGLGLLALSGTCRWMREATLPWIFREVYDFPGFLWHESLWTYFR